MRKFYAVLAIILSAAMLLQNIVMAENETMTPFVEHTIPCTINAADFDYGGLNVAYNVNGTINGKYVYREDAQMNFYTGNGIVVGFNANDWMKYTVEVSEACDYNVYLCYTTPNANSGIEIKLDGEVILLPVLPATSDSWSDANYKTKKFGRVSLPAGTHVLQMKMLTGSCTFKSVIFEKYTASEETDFSRKTGAFRYHCLPCKIEAEDFDMSGSAVKSEDDDVYRDDEGIAVEGDEESHYIRLNKNQKADYTFIAENSGVYLVSLAAKGKIALSFDNEEALEISCANASEKTDAVNVWLDKGEHKLTIRAIDSVNIDYISFVSGTDEYRTVDKLSGSTDIEQTEKIYKEFYVSADGSDSNQGTADAPFKTIEKARNEIRKVSDDMDGDILVHIQSGNYMISDKLVFNEADSGKNGYQIIYKGDNKLDAPVINGGTQITGWKKMDDYIWYADTDVENTRTLYINGLAAQRARSKYLYYAEDYADSPETSWGEDAIVVSAKNFPKNITHGENLELVWNLFWTDQHTPVERLEFSEGKAIFWMKQPWFHYARTKSYDGTNPSKDKMFYIENALELLDEPGEFYFDRESKRIYYYPFKNEDLTTAEAYVGTTEFLMDIKGSGLENKIQNIAFDNIAFKYGAWNGASEQGVVCSQADKNYTTEGEAVSSGGAIIPSQITIEYAKNITITNCRLSSLGSSGISLTNAVSQCNIVGNSLTDISGSGIIVGHWDHTNTMPVGNERVTDVYITDNVIRRAAEEFKGGCGISIYYVNSVTVDHNDIKNVPYSGITTGWGWGTDVTDVADNSVSYNRIEDVTSVIPDGGSIYNLGPQRNSYMTGNYLIKSGDSRGGLYFDQGSRFITAKDTVVSGMTGSQLWLHAPNAAMKDIVVEDSFTDTNNMWIEESTVTVKNTTYVPDGNWPERAVEIMNEAGVRPKYRKLLAGVEYPEWRTNFIHKLPNAAFKGATSDGTVEAEDYMGGAEVGFHKQGGAAVRLYDTVGGLPGNKVIGATNPGDWLKYEINIPIDGRYKIALKTANAFTASDTQPCANVYIDDEQVVSNFPIPNNGSWNEHIWNAVADVDVSAGTHIVKVEFADNGFSFDALRLYNPKLEQLIDNDDTYDEGIIVTEEELRRKVFADISGHWAESVINELAQKDIIHGIGDGLFAPDANVTARQSARLLITSCYEALSEADLENKAVELGLIADASLLDRPITREEFAMMLMRVYAAYIGKYKLTWDEKAYNDFMSIDEKYQNSVLGAKELGLMSGDDTGRFNPDSVLTRAEAATVIYHLLGIK